MASKMVKNPCWKGYVMYGTKMQDGKEVPNCIKEGEDLEEENTTASAGGEYQTPNAFAGSKSKWKKRVPKGYSEPFLYYENIMTSSQTIINEVSYNDFKSDNSSAIIFEINKIFEVGCVFIA